MYMKGKLMTQPDIIQTILKDSNYHLELFTDAEVQTLREKIFPKTVRGKETPHVNCPIRGREVQLKPEEVVRQLYTARLMHPKRYDYPLERIRFEYVVNFGREQKRADIVILDKDRPDTAYIIVEVKKPKLQDGKDQLKSYCNATGATMGVWTNGKQISHYHRKDPNYFEDLTNIPDVHQTLEDILRVPFTLKDLILKDKLVNERKTLKDVILELEDEVLANAGVDVFEEVFKLIFTKLYDEFESQEDKEYINRIVRREINVTNSSNYEAIRKVVEKIPDEDIERSMEFRNPGQTLSQLKTKIQRLFDRAKDQWEGVFPEQSTFELSDSHLSVCVSSLQDVKLFNSNLQIIDEAFEYLVNKSARGEKGQYFTPRHVIDMCVKMLNPQRRESMVDTASGSCGFPVHTFFQVTHSSLTNAEKSEPNKQYMRENVFGIDFDEKAVRVARTLNLIAGDGESNVLHLNTLDYERWSDRTDEDGVWINTYGKGFRRLKKLRAKRGGNKFFKFDILMANPPFAGDIRESRILHQYELGFKENRKPQSKVGRDILFIERNLDFLKPGGRMAIVLPQGRFNNTSDIRIRKFIAKHARILAVVGLDTNTFKPHTGTKTSVLFLQKWNNDPDKGPLCCEKDDYPIFFAVSQKSGKDNSGDYEYLKDDAGQYKLDKKGHPIVKHDLHNHNDERPDGIAEVFIQWARDVNLSFWNGE